MNDAPIKWRTNALVNITVPVYNEEKVLPASIETLHSFLTKSCRFDWEIVIANNGSTDRSQETAIGLAASFPGVSVCHLPFKGRGGALARVWSASRADFLSYMDVDLSTNLSFFPPMLEALISGGFDLGVGSRLLKPSTTKRGPRRAFISRGYNVLVKTLFFTRFSDAQCGFKAITSEAAKKLLPGIEDTGWFFDTELLVLAEKTGCRIFDLPVAWAEDWDSRVNIVQTALEDIRGLIRLRRRLWQRMS